MGYFNLRGWSQLAESVDAVQQRPREPKVRLLIGMAERSDDDLRQALRIRPRQPIDHQTADRLRIEAMRDLREQLTCGLPSRADETTLRTLKQQLATGAVAVKLHLRHRLHAKLYLCSRESSDNPMTGYVGSSNLTFAGLADQGELNVDVLDHDATQKLLDCFEERWEDQYSIDVTDDLICVLEKSWVRAHPLCPYLVYLKMAYHLSLDAREGLLEYGLPKELRTKLLDFQAAAVQIAVKTLDRRAGVMIGDVVGLGKTIVGTAIARLWQEERGGETLIVCPKNLVDMWEGYMHTYRLLAKVLSLSMATRELPDMRRYRIVIVDESHNLRRSSRKDYAALKAYVDRNDSKVVLLTATPYNVDFSDAANQLALFVREDVNLGITPHRAIEEMGEVEFLHRCKGKTETLKAFSLSDYPEDWQRLMSLFLIRRTRRFIMDYYAHTDESGRKFLHFSDGGRFHFPEREPKPLKPDQRDEDPARLMLSDETIDTISRLCLPRYTAAKYLSASAAEEASMDERVIIKDLKRALRGNLRGMTLSLLYKRLSSSLAAFMLSIKRHVLRNLLWLAAIESTDKLPVGPLSNALLDDEEADARNDGLFGNTGQFLDRARSRDDWSAAACEAYGNLRRSSSKQVQWIASGLFTQNLASDLHSDVDKLLGLLELLGNWNPSKDSKLDRLERLLTTEHPDDKVLIFTEYKDTAVYVAEALMRRGISAVGWVSGATENPTSLARRFAPKSNASLGKNGGSVEDELRVLVATDVLSEGQNLQDAHVVVNFDLPWGNRQTHSASRSRGSHRAALTEGARIFVPTLRRRRGSDQLA